MSTQENVPPLRERGTFKRRSSILKRQDTCVLTEDFIDEGPRTPRRVSFAQNTMIKEFYSIPWQSDDSSLHSSRGSQSSSSSDSQESQNPVRAKAYRPGSLSEQQSLLDAELLKSTLAQKIEFEGRSKDDETSTVVQQNRTIHFQDLDESGGNMNLTTNLMELSRSVCQKDLEDEEEDPASVLPPQYQARTCGEPGMQDWGPVGSVHQAQTCGEPGTQDWSPVGSLHHMTSDPTMEVTQNLAWEVSHVEGPDERFLGMMGETTQRFAQDDMELTADLMYTSRSALLDITGCHAPASALAENQSLVKVGAVPTEDQENNPLLILQASQQKSKLGMVGVGPVTSPKKEGSAEVPTAAIYDRLKGSGLAQVSGVASAMDKRRSRLTDQFPAQLLSPVGEVSGLNSSAWASAQDNSSLSQILARSLSASVAQERSQDMVGTESQSQTIHFGSLPTADAGCEAGDLEMTENVGTGAWPSQQAERGGDSQSKTIYFGCTGASGSDSLAQDGRDMELTEACCATEILQGSYANEGYKEMDQVYPVVQDNVVGSSEVLESSTNMETESKTIYFGSAANDGDDKGMDMELTTAVTSQGEDEDDPEISFNFSSSASGQRKSFPQTPDDIAAKLKDASVNISNSQKEKSLNRSEKHQQQHLSFTEVEKEREAFQRSRNEQTEKSVHVSTHSILDYTGTARRSDSGASDADLVISMGAGLESSATSGCLRTSAVEATSDHSAAGTSCARQAQLVERTTENTGTSGLDGSKYSQVNTTQAGGMKNKEKAKTFLMDMGNFLSLSRRGSNAFNMLKPRKSTGLLFAGQAKDASARSNVSMSALKPNTSMVQILNLSKPTEEEVDGAANASVFNSPEDLHSNPSLAFASEKKNSNSAAPVLDRSCSSTAPPVLNSTNSSLVSLALDHANSSTLNIHSSKHDPGLSNKNSSIIAPVPRNTNSSFSAQQKVSLTGATNDINTSSLTSTTNERNTSANGFPTVSQLYGSANQKPGSPPVPPAAPEADMDLSEELSMGDLTEDLHIQNFFGNRSLDAEAAEGLLQDLECVMSEASAHHRSQEKLFSLQELYSTVGFEPNIVQEEIPQQEILYGSTREKLHTGIAVIPKVKSLQQLVVGVEQTVSRLQQENSEKLYKAGRNLSELGSLLAQDKGDLKKKAVDMCQACRMMSRTKWRHQEADHLLKFSTLRENAFEKLSSDVEALEKDTVRCRDLTSEIDKCIQEIQLIQDIQKDLSSQEKMLVETRGEVEHLRKRSQGIDEQVRSVEDSSEDMLSQSEGLAVAQEAVQDQLSWLGSLTEWTVLKQSGQEWHFGFLFNTLVLQVRLVNHTPQQAAISDLSLKSRLAGSSKPWAKLCHHLAISSIDLNALKSQYHSRDQLSKLLLKVSAVVCKCRQLSTELRQAHLRHRVVINDGRLEVYILDRKLRQKIRLQTSLEPPCHYPDAKLSWNISTVLGNALPEKIEEAVSLVSPGQLHLTRVLEAAQIALMQCGRL